jgi:tRNA pseudouridine32 synthase / 23S rRNA pseudouridine746 synthase
MLCNAFSGSNPKAMLLRTPAAEAAALALIQELQAHDLQVAAQDPHQPRYDQDGKMYGVLIAETTRGEQVVLKAFSGWLWGQGEWPGWVPPIPGRQEVALLEAATLAELDDIKQRLWQLQHLPIRQELAGLEADFKAAQQELQTRNALAKQQRQQQRQTGLLTLSELAQLEAQSQTDSRQFRQFKKDWRAKLQPFQDAVNQANQQMLTFKQHRRKLSQQLQIQLHQAYTLQNFAGQSSNLEALSPGLPTGTGDCCAPKLLQAAAQQGLRPIALAEFWWGPAQENCLNSQNNRVPGQFYEPCAERCQPIMGFLLSGLSLGDAFGQAVLAANSPTPLVTPSLKLDLPIIYEDAGLLIINKPAGLLSVPGRYQHSQDSVWSRLVQVHPQLRWVHRLDQDTSGLLVLAKDLEIYRQLYPQWQQRQVEKIYEAIVVGNVEPPQGQIDLPLRADPHTPLRQRVDLSQGKPSQTEFRVLECRQEYRQSEEMTLTRLELCPLTGRTHQLRVHTAIGLNTPILGDQLYDCPVAAGRLYLHARALKFWHPQVQQFLSFHAPTPF